MKIEFPERHLGLITVGLLYGANYSILKSVTPQYLDPFGFLVIRVGIATIFFVLVGLIINEKFDWKNDGIRLACCAIFGMGINMLCFYKGMSLTSAVNGSIIMTFTPIIVFIFAVIFLKEKLKMLKVIGLILGLVGVLIIIYKDNGTQSGGNWFGDLLILINAITYGAYLVIVKPLLRKYNSLTVMMYAFIIGFFMILPFGWTELVNSQWTQIPSKIYWSMGYAIFGATVMVYFLNTAYMIEDESDAADATVRAALIDGIKSTGLSETNGNAEELENAFALSSSSKVGATIADDIKNSSYESALFALICIFIYILIRFRKWQFGLGAIAALFHDTLFVLSAFAIASLLGMTYEVDQVFVAAILTIIGYSINDTVVVFDRIRENLGIKTGSEMKKVFNESLNSTISRTLITSVTTLIVVLVLFLFGGPALKGFSFALLVGILIDTYSSVFIATPVVIDLNSKKEG